MTDNPTYIVRGVCHNGLTRELATSTRVEGQANGWQRGLARRFSTFDEFSLVQVVRVEDGVVMAEYQHGAKIYPMCRCCADEGVQIDVV